MRSENPGQLAVTDLIHKSGLWAGDGVNTHGFRATTTLVEFTPEQVSVLTNLGPAIAEVMDGMSRILAISQNIDLAQGATWNMVRKTVAMQVPTFMKRLQDQFVARTPKLVKVDFMEDGGGQFHIAELDATNRRGLGYTSLFELIRSAISPAGVPVGKPIVIALAELVKQLCDAGHTAQLGYVYAHKERFYLPEFTILRRELAKHGVELLLGSEQQTRVVDDTVVINNVPCQSGLLTDFALKLERPDLANELIRLYLNKRLKLLIPPRPFLGSKGLMALLHNADQDPQLEAILRSQINHQVLTLMRQHIPLTRFVTRQTPRPERGVLKEVMSSGMHGVYFVSDPGFEAGFRDAKSRPYQYVLQDEIDCRPRRFDIITENGTMTEELRTRLIVYYVNRQLAGGVITGAPGKCIHGGRQAVFTSTVRM